MAGRKPGFRHHEEVRAKIKAGGIINRLVEHIMSPVPIMDASQVNAAKALLNKVLPDLSAVNMEVNGHIETTSAEQREAAVAAAILAAQADQDRVIN